MLQKKQYFLGTYENIEDAAEARSGYAQRYCRLTNNRRRIESNSIANHDVMYRGWITPKNITS